MHALRWTERPSLVLTPSLYRPSLPYRCPLSPRSVGSFWSDSDSEEEGEADEDEDKDNTFLAACRRSRLSSQGSQFTLASSESSSLSSREGERRSRWNSRSSINTLRSESATQPSHIKGLAPQLDANIDVKATSSTEAEKGKVPHSNRAQRPALKSHCSFPIPSSPTLPDVFVDSSGAALSPWPSSSTSARPLASELERRRSWQSPTTVETDRSTSDMHCQAARGLHTQRQEKLGGADAVAVNGPRSSGPSFTDKFSSSRSPRTPVDEQRERISRMAARVVSAWSPYDTPQATSGQGSVSCSSLGDDARTGVGAEIGLGLDVGQDAISSDSSSLASSTVATASPLWPSSAFGIWSRQHDNSPPSSKRTSMPPLPRPHESAATLPSHHTPLILQTNSPSLYTSPALGATAQSCWSSSSYVDSPRVECRSPFSETVEEVATGSPLLRPDSLSSSLARRNSTGVRSSGSFSSSPLASRPLNADSHETHQQKASLVTATSSREVESSEAEVLEVQHLLGFVQHQREKPHSSQAPGIANGAIDGNQSTNLYPRLSNASDVPQYDWNQFRNASIASSAGAYSRHGSFCRADLSTRPANWPSAAFPPALNPGAKSFTPQRAPQQGDVICRSSSTGSLEPSSWQTGLLTSSSSDSWLSLEGKTEARRSQLPSMPIIVGTPATPLREVNRQSCVAPTELPRRSFADFLGFDEEVCDPGRESSASSSCGSTETCTRRKPTKRGTRSGKRVQKARSERLLRAQADESVSLSGAPEMAS